MATDFTISDVLAWARTKPADETYCYTDFRNCAVAQFGKATGREYLTNLGGRELRGLNAELEDAVNPGAHFWRLGLVGSTFGMLVKRLETFVPAEPVSDTWTKADAYLTDIESVEA